MQNVTWNGNSDKASQPQDNLTATERKLLLRAEAFIYVAQVDRQLPLSPDRLLKLAWLASELAAMVELRG